MAGRRRTRPDADDASGIDSASDWRPYGSIRLAILVASTLLAVLFQAPSSFAGTLAPLAALAQTPVTFTGPTNFAAGDSPASIAVGDFNGDTDPDLAVANDLSDTVSVLLGSAGGGFAAATNFATGSFPYSVAVGDFNGDTDPDLAVANLGSGTISVLLGAAGGGFTAPATVATAAGPWRSRWATSTATRTPTWRSPTSPPARP